MAIMALNGPIKHDKNALYSLGYINPTNSIAKKIHVNLLEYRYIAFKGNAIAVFTRD